MKEFAIKIGFLDFAIAVLTRTPSHPSSMAIVASEAVPNPASTITGSFILNSILIEVAGMLKNEKIFPFYISSNMPNASKNNNRLEKKFKKINPHL